MPLSMVVIFFLFDVLALVIGFFIGYRVSQSLLLDSVVRIQGELINLQSLNSQLSSDMSGMRAEIEDLRSQITREESANRHLRANLVQVMTLRGYEVPTGLWSEADMPRVSVSG